MFLQTQQPHNAIKKDTFGKWVKATLQNAGIDMQVFSPHSVRSAATSAAKGKGVPLSTILRTAGWETDCVFRKFYDRPIGRNITFAKTVLESVDQ